MTVVLTGKWPSLNPDNDRRLNPSVQSKKVRSKNQAMQACISSVFADLKSAPDTDAPLDAQLLHGEAVLVHEQKGDWCLVQSVRDHYCGWCEAKNLSDDSGQADHKKPDHKISVPRTFLYPEPDMKSPRSDCHSLASLVTIVSEAEMRGTRYFRLDTDQWLIADHVRPINDYAQDFVAIAEQLLHTPYLWGGSTAFGLDCSGLVQLSMRMAGIEVLRDSDMQAATIGNIVEPSKNWRNLQRGDLIFWLGHVAICQGMIEGEQHIIHANGASMSVKSEPLAPALERIAHLYSQPVGVRRVDALCGNGKPLKLPQ